MISSILMLPISSLIFANGQEAPYSPQFDPNLQYLCPDSFQTDFCLTPGWYFQEIGMDEVVQELDLYGNYQSDTEGVTNFSIGVIDSGLSKNNSNFPHDYIDYGLINYINKSETYGVGNRSLHGNAVAGLISIAKVSEGVPVRPLIRAKTNFFGLDNRLRPDGETDNSAIMIDAFTKTLNSSPRPRVINSSITYVEDYESLDSPASEIDLLEHYNFLAPLRELIGSEENEDVLFVLAAGNHFRNAKFGNGMLHYQFINGDFKYRPLDNLIIVGAHNKTRKLVRYSNFGKSVDITAPTSVIALSCANASHGTDGIFKASVEDFESTGIIGNPYGSRGITRKEAFEVKRANEESGYNELLRLNIGPCGGHGLAFGGTSASTPLVSGAAAILFYAADEGEYSIFPSEIKEYLTEGNMGFVFKRYLGIESQNTDQEIDEYGHKYLSMNNIIPALNVKNALDLLNIQIEKDSFGNLNEFIEDGYSTYVGGQQERVYRKVDDEIADFDGEVGLFIDPNTTACIVIDSEIAVDFTYLDNNDQAIEIGSMYDNCQNVDIPEYLWEEIDNNQPNIPFDAGKSNGLSIRLTGPGSGILITEAELLDPVTGNIQTIVYDNQ